MKQLLLFFLAVMLSYFAKTQTVNVYHENFESPSNGDSVSSSTVPAGGSDWTLTSNLAYQGAFSDSMQVQTGKIVYLTTTSMSTVGKTVVYLKFAQICKVFYGDGGFVEVSPDGGTTWVSLTDAHYKGSGVFTGNRFCESSYVSDWTTDSAAIPNNTWWKQELFDISAIAANKTDVKVRFKLADGFTPGGGGRYGWLIDDIKIIASTNEIDPPVITLTSQAFGDTVYSTGPFIVSADITDANTISSAMLYYTVNGGAEISIPMSQLGSNYSVEIPSLTYNNIIRYRIEAMDNFGNVANYPITGYKKFLILKGPQYYQIGTGTSTSYNSPLYINTATSTYKYSNNIALFKSNELNISGLIKSISWNKSNFAGYSNANATLRIYFKHTTATSVPTTSTAYASELAGAVKVYESTTQNLNTSTGWQDFVFNTINNFTYNGNDNLFVFTEWYRPDNATGEVDWYYTTTAGSSYTFYGTANPPASSAGSGNRANVKFGIIPTDFNTDAGVTEINSPVGTLVNTSPLSIKVRIKNYGTDTLKSAKVFWALDGTQLGNFTYNGLLCQDVVSSVVTIGNLNLPNGSHQLKVWTALPNDSIDKRYGNDTLSVNLYGCSQILNGTYTVGTSSADFPTFDDLISTLSNCGVSGPVTIKVKSGTYNQQINFGSIQGASSVNRVVIEPESGNANDVVITYAATSSSTNYVVKLNNTNYLTIRNLLIKPAGSSYGYGIVVSGASNYNVFESNKIEIPASTLSDFAGIYDGSSIDNYNTYRNNNILNGYYGIYCSGSSTSSLQKGSVIEGNTINGFYYYGIYANYNDSAYIAGNTLNCADNSAAVTGIYAGYNDNHLGVVRNKIHVHGTGTNYGIYMYYSDNTAIQPGLVANNFVSQSVGTGSVQGISNYYSMNQNYYHNSVNVTAGSTSGYAFYSTGSSTTTNANVKNNIFSNTSSGYAYYISTIATIGNSDYNDLYATGTNLAYWSGAKTTLAALRTASSKDSNSVSVNPQFPLVTDLHLNTSALNNLGTPLSSVTTDIDGNTRSSSTPDMGADEFDLIMNEAGISAFVAPVAPCQNASIPVVVKLKNYGLSPLTSVNIEWSVNGVMQNSFVFNGNVPSLATSNVTIGNFTFAPGQIYSLKIWSSMPNGVLDQNLINDTLLVNSIQTALPGGVYSVGTPTSDYATINQVINDVQTKGICGPVVFNIASGTYNTNMLLSNIKGTSSVNTIILQSATGNKSDVVINYASSGSADNYVIKLDGTNYVTIRNLTLKATGSSYGRVIELAGGSSNNMISNCILEMPVTTSSNYAGVYSSSTAIESRNEVSNNEIRNGYNGIYFAGTSAMSEVSNIYYNNTITGYTNYGICLAYQDSSIVKNNGITSAATTVSSFAGIYASAVVGKSEISSNTIKMMGNNTGNGIYLTATTSILPARMTIANNFISQSDAGTNQVTGLSLNSSYNIQVYYNSVNITSANNASRAFYLTGGSGNRLLNNIFANTGAGYALYNSTATAIDSSDYNDLYSASTSKFAYWTADRASLAALKTASNKDQHSVSLNPNYSTTHNLHINSSLLNGIALALPEISNDIDGDARNTSTPDIGADEFNLRQNDVGIIAYTSSMFPCSITGSDIQVKLKNFGVAALNSAEINWSVNGVMQTPYLFTGNVAYGADTTIIIGSYSFPSAQMSSIKVWNGILNSSFSDEDHSNDTLFTNVKSSLNSGIYTISATSGADYSSFNSAVNTLVQYGICGPVTFNVAPGTYTEQITLPEIQGASPINTITFKSIAGDSLNTILTYESTASTDNYVFSFNGSDYVTIQGLTLQNTGATYAKVFELKNVANYNIIRNNRIISNGTGSSSAGIYSESTKDQYNTIQGNRIENGYYGIYFTSIGSAAGEKEAGNRFINNTIVNSYYYGFYSYYQDTVQFIGNLIQNSPSSGTFYGLYAYYNDNLITSKNKVLLSGTGSNYGIYLYYCNNSAGNALVSNNFVSQVNGTSTIEGIYNSSSNNVEYYNNTSVLYAGNSSSDAFYLPSGSNIKVKNNNFVNYGSGYAIYVSSATALTQSDNNNFFVKGTNLSYYTTARTTLAAWQSATGKDTNSVSADPMFASTEDFHTNSVMLYRRGAVLPQITDDIEGDLRPANPCIGADEFSIPANDLALLTLNTYGKLAKDAATPHKVKSVVQNLGANTLYNIPVTLTITGVNNFNSTVVIDSLKTGDKDTLFFADYNPAILGYSTVKVNLPNDDVNLNNEMLYQQKVTDSLFGYADTAAVKTNFGFNTGSGYFLTRYHINTSRNINAVKAFITNSNTIGQRIYAVVMDNAGIVLDTSASKIITAQDTNTWVYFPMSDSKKSNVIDEDVLVGIAQTIGTTGGYYPLGCQKENNCRANTFYYSFGLSTVNLVNATQYGRFMIDAELGYPNNHDASVAEILTPVSGCGKELEQVKITILNVGTDTIYGNQNTLVAHYIVDNDPATHVSQQVTDVIPSAQGLDFTFTTPANIPAHNFDSVYTIKVWVTLAQDFYHVNDTLSKDVLSKYTPVAPSVTNITVPYATTGQFNIPSIDTAFWYINVNDTTPVFMGNHFTTPILFDTTTYYVESAPYTSFTKTIGTGTSTQVYPFYHNFGFSRSASLYQQSEVGSYGYIKQIKWKVTTASTVTIPVKIYMKSYSAQSMVSDTWLNLTSNAQLVFDDTITFNSTGWKTVTLETPFYYNSGNMMVLCEENIGGNGVSGYLYFEYTSTSISGSHQYVNADNSAPTGATTLNSSRPNIQIVMDVKGCASPKVPAVAVVTNIPAIDASVNAVVEPSGSVTAGVPVPVKVTLKNFGSSTLTSAQIQWSVDGIVQTPATWNGSLISGQTSAPYQIALKSFIGGAHILKVWVVNPNNQVDNYPINDSASTTINACMTGNFTIGGASADYPNFTQAINAMISSGVCGNVVFTVNQGVYNEQLLIPSITGVGSNTTVTFRSALQDSTAVKVINNSSTALYTLKLDAASYFTFERISFKAEGSVGRALEMVNGSNHNNFTSCVFETSQSTSNSYAAVYSASTGAAVSYNTFTNNRMLNGYYGLYWYGSSSARKNKNVFIGNSIEGFYYCGASLSYCDTLLFKGNTLINDQTSSGTIYGIYGYYSFNSTIVGNKLNIGGSSSNYCLYMHYCNSSSSGKSLVANNFVSQSVGTSSAYGLYSNYTYNTEYFNNSVNMNAGSATGGYAFYVTGGDNVRLKNNTLANNGPGYAVYFSSTTAVTESDYNNFYAKGLNLGYYSGAKTDLASLQSASSKDQHSVSRNPYYTSASDLHTTNFYFYQAGTPITSITEDIDGDVRGAVPCIGADEFALPQNDAGIIALTTPVNPLMVSGVQNVRVKVKNFGLNTLNSVVIKWSVNGAIQPSYNWSGSLVTGAEKDSVIIGTFNFSAGTYNIVVWTELPNNLPEGLNYNDTVRSVIYGCSGGLSGNYTIGGTGANYSTIADAITHLSVCGISGSVVFDVAPGAYAGNIVIGSINGASNTNTITFKSANNDSTSVNIQYAATGSSDNYVLKLDNAHHLRFRNITFESNTTTTYGRVIELSNQSNNNLFKGCVIKSIATTSSNSAVVYSYSTTANTYNTFENNLVLNGYYGFYFAGSTTVNHYGSSFVNNKVKGFYYYGIYTTYADSVNVRGNDLISASNSATGYGIYINHSGSETRVLNNKVHLLSTTSSYPLYIEYLNGTAASPILIANNFLSQKNATTTVNGAYVGYSNYVNFIHNSVNVTSGAATTSRGLYLNSASTGNGNIILLNNSIANNGLGVAVEITTTATTSSYLATSNYNNLYAASSTLATYGATPVNNLSSWQTNSGKDANSVSLNPDYMSESDLHVYSSALNNKGSYTALVTTDIDGQLRNNSTPDIGADEFTPQPIDVSVMALLEPTNYFAPVNASVPLRVILKNFGATDVSNFNVGFKVGNNATVTTVINDVLSSNETDTFTLVPSMTVVQGANTLRIFTAVAGDGNLNNDTISLTFNGVPVVVAPFHDNFDLTTTDWMTLGGNSDWEHGAPNSSVINTAHSAPYVWKTKLNGNYNNNGTYILYSPIFSSGQFQMDTLKFWMWMDAEANQDGGHIEYLNGQGVWKILGVSSDPNGVNWYNGTSQNMWTGQTNGWQEVKYELQSVNDIGLNTQFRFIFTSNATNNANGWAIDDFAVTLKMIDQDGGVVAIIKPQATQNTGNQVSPKVTLKNFGVNPLTSIPVKYSVNGNMPVTETWTGNLAPGATVDFQLAGLFTVHTQNIAFCAYTAVIGDIYTGNDSLCMTVNVQPAQNDAGISQIIGLDQAAQFTSVPVKAVIKNYGSAPLTSVPVKYQRGSAAIVSETWTGAALSYGDSVVYTFTQQLQVPAGSSFNLCVWTNLVNEQYAQNDKVCKNVQIVVGVGETENSLFTLGQNIPNPSKGNTLIPFELKESGKVQFRLINQLGQQLFESENYFDLGKQQIDLNTENYPAGIYFYSIEFKGKRLLNKMIVE
jgi:hypothetical protein